MILIGGRIFVILIYRDCEFMTPYKSYFRVVNSKVKTEPELATDKRLV